MSTTTMPGTALVAIPDKIGTPTTTRVLPSATMGVRISTGDWVDQFLAHNEPEIAAVVQAGFRAVTSLMPFGGVVLGIVNTFGPKIIDDYVLMGVNYIRSVVEPLGIDVASGHPYMASIAVLINDGEKRFAAFMGDDLHAMIEAGLKRFGIDVHPGYVPALPSPYPPVKNPSGAIGGN